MHGHPASVAVFLNDCEARFTYPDGKTEDVKAKAGQVLYFRPWIAGGDVRRVESSNEAPKSAYEAGAGRMIQYVCWGHIWLDRFG